MTPGNFPTRALEASYSIADPGASGTIVIDKQFGIVRLITAAAESRTLAAPTKTGIFLTINMVTDGGDCTLTVTGGYDEAGNTTMVFNNTGDYADFKSMEEGAGTYVWRLTGFDGVTGPTETGGSLVLAGSLSVGTTLTLAGTAFAATADEINRAADLSTRIVPLAVTTILTEASHEGKTIVMSGAGGARTFTLPAATAAGGRYRFVVGEVNTSNYLIKAAVGTDLFEGMIIGASTTDSATDAARTWLSGATDDTVTLNGTTTGGVAIGDWLEFEDISATGWAVRGMITQSGTEATPFSDTVT